MGAFRQGGGHLSLPENVEKCFLLQMLSKTSGDEVLMHHFEKMLPQTPGELPMDPARRLLSFRPPHCPPLEKILRSPMDRALEKQRSLPKFSRVISGP